MTRTDAPQKPIVALLGEFSAGKSTLVNVLMKEVHSPTRVTATQLPPVWYRYGTASPVHIARDGEERPLPDGDLSAAPMGDTRAIRVEVEADILKACDLIDMPGSSDPNMTPDIWDALLPMAQGVIWCSPATQAWRQSEAAIWEEVPDALYERSLLLLTRIDKVRATQDRARLLTRVQREVDGQFRKVLPVALIRALDGPEDEDGWLASGMDPVLAALGEILEDIGGTPSLRPVVSTAAAQAATAVPANDPDPVAQAAPAIMPRRVTRLGGGGRRARSASGDGSLI